MMSSTQPDVIRNIYNFVIPPYYGSVITNVGFRVKSYFVAPMDGAHIFSVVCNDAAILYFGESESTKQQIVNCVLISYGELFVSSIKSASLTLQSGKKYYMEATLYENSGSIWVIVGVQLPNGSQKRITQRYLIAYP